MDDVIGSGPERRPRTPVRSALRAALRRGSPDGREPSPEPVEPHSWLPDAPAAGGPSTSADGRLPGAACRPRTAHDRPGAQDQLSTHDQVGADGRLSADGRGGGGRSGEDGGSVGAGGFVGAGDGLPAADGWSTGAVAWRPRSPVEPVGVGDLGTAGGTADDGLGDDGVTYLDEVGEEPGGRPRRRPGRSRLALTAVGVLAAAGIVVGLRSGTEPARTVEAALPSPVATPNVYARVRLQPPPFDRLPGRTPIPDPTTAPDRRTVGGSLVAVGDRTPGPVTAELATRLVLGRYCRRPWSLDVRPQALSADWTRVRARAVRTGWLPAVVDVRLSWDATTRTYAWTSATAQLDTCS